MQVLLSSIGSRGDVQPIVALALELRALGHHARLCVAPNFKEWIESYGLECTPIGPDLKKLTGADSARMFAPRGDDACSGIRRPHGTARSTDRRRTTHERIRLAEARTISPMNWIVRS